jgi:glycosyltransferase involved in cell wall biosynthesis
MIMSPVKRMVFYHPRAAKGDGGVTNSLWQWVAALRASGVEVVVLTDSREPGVTGNSEREVIGVPHVGRGKLRFPKGLHNFCAEGDVFVLSSGWVAYNWMAARALTRLRIQYIIVPHGAYDPAITQSHAGTRRLAALFERNMLNGAKFVHIFSAAERSHVATQHPCVPSLVSPTGVQIALPADRWAGGEGYLAWIGRYDVEHKGIDLLFQSLSLVGESRRPLIRLRGRDSKQQRGDIVRLAATYGVEGWVNVGGPISGSEKERFLRNSAGYVHPSRWECHSMVLGEALSMGVPCVVSGDISMASELRKSQAVILASPGSSEFGEAMAVLATGSGSQDLADRAHSFAKNHLAWDVSVPRLVDALMTQGSANG